MSDDVIERMKEPSFRAGYFEATLEEVARILGEVRFPRSTAHGKEASRLVRQAEMAVERAWKAAGRTKAP